MEFRPTVWLTIAAALVIAVLGVNFTLELRNVTYLRNESSWVAHTHEVLTRLERVFALAQGAEADQRGYILTGDRAYLDPYHRAVSAIPAQIDTLQALTADNRDQLPSYPAWRAHLAARLREMNRLIAVRDSAGFDAARTRLDGGTGQVGMDSVRTIVGRMARRERALLATRNARAEDTYRNAVGSAVLAGALGIFTMLAYLWVLQRNLKARQASARLLADEAERYRTTIASLGDAVIATDLQGRVTTLNPVAERLTGWAAAEAVGRPLAEVFRIVDEASRETALDPARRAIAEGTIVGLANHTVLIGKDAREWPIEDSAAPIRSALGDIVGCVLVFRDVSERRAADLALAQSEERLRLAVEAADVGTWVWDVPNDVVRADARVAILYGIDAEELERGVPVVRTYEHVDPRDAARLREDVRRAVTAGGLFESEYRTRSDGSEHWLRARGRVEHDGGGRAFRMSGTILEVTDQKLAERELSEADRRKDVFLATLAHELRNPLAPLRNGLQILTLTHDAGETAVALHMMDRQLGQMVSLIDDLLDLSRISQGKIVLKRERLELARLVREAVDTVRPAIADSGNSLTLELADEPLRVEADPTRLAQVFTNLLTNAAKYTERGGSIRVTVTRDGSDARVAVRDTGIGLAPAQLPRIFEMFTQVERATDRAQGGLGIGLWLVRQLVELHGGRVEASSAGPGKGSMFEVRLPLAVAAPAPAPAATPAPVPTGAPAAAPAPPVAAPAPARVPGRRRVLVVDDNRDAANSLALLLDHMGHETRVAHDGAEALEMAATYRPDIVLLDIGMPRMNGFDAARALRREPWGRDMTLIALTGWGQEHDRRSSQEAGFDHHLVKPVEPGSLLRLLGDMPGVPGA
jgi:PAS domain S-box-containing protein